MRNLEEKMKNSNKWKKALLTLSALSLLASCQEQTVPSSSVSSPSSEDIVSSKDEMADYKALQTMLRNLSDGVSLESLVTTTATFGEGNSKQSQYYRFYLDVQNTKNEYAYQQYKGVDSASGTPNKDTLEASGDLTKTRWDMSVRNIFSLTTKSFFTLSLKKPPKEQVTLAGQIPV